MRLLCIISLFLCYAVSSEIGFYDQCAFMKGITFSNTSYFDEELASERVLKRSSEIALNCGSRTQPTDKEMRAACYSVVDEMYGIDSVEAEHYFPFLSYRRKVDLSSQIEKISYPKSSPDECPTTRIAFIILAHQNYEQTTRMLRSIYHKDHVYLIHVDAKNEELHAQLRDFTSRVPNMGVMDLESSFKIAWGSIEMVYATLEAMFSLLDVGRRWDYVINLSGQDYPLCSTDEFARFLDEHYGANFDFAYIPPQEVIEYRVAATSIFSDEAAAMSEFSPEAVCRPPIPPKNIPVGFELWATSQWFVYHRNFVTFLRTSPDAARLLALYENSHVPDEAYFATVLMNTRFAPTRIRNTLHYVRFEPDSIHPDVFKVGNFSMLTSNEANACYARKFDAEVDSDILDKLDVWRASKQPNQFFGKYFHEI